MAQERSDGEQEDGATGRQSPFMFYWSFKANADGSCLGCIESTGRAAASQFRPAPPVSAERAGRGLAGHHEFFVLEMHVDRHVERPHKVKADKLHTAGAASRPRESLTAG